MEKLWTNALWVEDAEVGWEDKSSIWLGWKEIQESQSIACIVHVLLPTWAQVTVERWWTAGSSDRKDQDTHHNMDIGA